MSEGLSTYSTALEHFNEYRSMLKMTTGSANLDSLIDSIQEGQCYLFYGNNKAVIEIVFPSFEGVSDSDIRSSTPLN